MSLKNVRRNSERTSENHLGTQKQKGRSFDRPIGSVDLFYLIYVGRGDEDRTHE